MKKPSQFTPSPALLAASAIAWTILVYVLDTLFPLGIAIAMLYTGGVLISLWSPRRRDTLVAATAGTILTIIGFFLSVPGGVQWMGLVNRLLAIALIWGSAVLILLHKQAKKDLAALRKLLPICASCKKIRDDKGYWQGLESYMEQHAQILFTHGMCSACVEKWYPELHPQAQERHPERYDKDEA